MNKLLIIIFSTLFIHSGIAISQNCAAKKIHYGECQQPFDLDYEDTGKSMSFPIVKGRTQKIVMTLPGKKDYYLSVCSESGDQLNFIIRNANNPDELIFDNSGFERPQSVEFSMLFANKLLFEITLPMVYGNDNKTKPICVGMLLFRKDN